MTKKHINIPVFIPHLGCPNQCVFCNQRTISGVSSFDISSVSKTIDEALSTIDKNTSEVEIAYFGGSFTGLEPSLMLELLKIAHSYIEKGLVDSIRLSTRPDYIDEKILDSLIFYGVKTVELGLQSASDKVLERCKRGHSFKDEERACRLITERGLDLVGQMMIGLPDSDLSDEIATAEFIVKSGACAARIYPTVVLESTELKAFCLADEYSPLSIEDAIFRSKEAAKIFVKNGVDIIRVGLCASENLVSHETYFAGPNHSALGELVYGELYYDLIREEINQSKDETKGKNLIIEAPIGFSSKIIGQKRRNAKRLEELYGFSRIRVCEKNGLSAYEIKIKILE